jgi:hypothetical protein
MPGELTHGWICQTCGVQYPPSEQPPSHCAICEDPRQYVSPMGQQWTTLDHLRAAHRNAWRREEPKLWSIRTEPGFGIQQQAWLVATPHGNVLWDCITLLDDATIDLIQALGGIQAIAISHPHYYSTMIEWSQAFGDVPVYLHELDRDWVQRTSPRVVFWSGASHQLLPGLTLVHCGGHFDGYQVLHWAGSREGRGAILAGDQPQVAMDRRWVTFLYSYPNMVPLSEAAVERITRALEPYEYDRLYGAFGRHVLADAKQAVLRSAARYIQHLRT